MRKFRTRFIVGGTVAVVAAATAFAITNSAVTATTVSTAELTTVAAKTATALSIVAGQSTIKPGKSTTISGTLLAGGSPAADKVVGLYRYNDRTRQWRLIRIKLTGKAGSVTFTVHPYITREYELKFQGNSSLSGAASSATTITVAPPAPKRATALSISATPASITADHPAKITGVLIAGSRPLAHRVVSLDRYDATTKKWVRVAVELTGPKGGVAFVREPSATSAFELVFAGGPLLTAARSATATVTVAG